MLHLRLAEALQLPLDQSQEELNTSIVALVNSAVHDPIPQISLSQLHTALMNSESASLLDPLDAIPLLLNCPDSAAKDIILLIGTHCSAKEVIIAVQERIERLEAATRDNIDEDGGNAVTAQLVTLTSLYSSAIPRLKLRKTPSATIRSLFSELGSLIQLTSGASDRHVLIHCIADLVQQVAVWAKTNSTSSIELSSANNILTILLESTLSACATSIRSSLARRTFRTYFPRFASLSLPEPGWEHGESAVSDAMNAAIALGTSLSAVPSQPSLALLILLAHSSEPLPAPESLLSSMLPIILTSIQSGIALDECLSLLLVTLSHAHSSSPKCYLSSEIIIPLSGILPPLASAHPDSSFRHITFRILSLLLSLCPSTLRLQVLLDMLCDPHFPQLRVAAVSLVKEAVLEGLSSPSVSSGKNVFSSPLLLQTFGPILFQPNPPDFFISRTSTESLQESMELPRLIECLALYYVLLVRDTHNHTGIRDTRTILDVERSLLTPIRSFLQQRTPRSDAHTEDFLPLAAMEIGLERVDTAVDNLHPKTP